MNRNPTQAGRLLHFGVLVMAGLTVNQQWFAAAADGEAGGNQPVRLAISDRVIRGVSLNDARAALGVWSAEIGKVAGFTPISQQDIVMPSQQLLAAVRAGKVDVFCLSTQEYREIAKFVDNNHILIDQGGGDDLLLVVREGSGINDLAGLRGRSLVLFDDVNASLAEPWLTVETWRQVHQMPAQLLRVITRSPKLSQAVLPVFFGQNDACIVTRRGLETLSEMNPQLARKLHVVMSLNKAPGALFACRRDFVSAKSIVERILDARSTAPSKQVLMLFQSRGFSLHNSDCLTNSISLLDAYERLNEHTANSK